MYSAERNNLFIIFVSEKKEGNSISLTKAFIPDKY